MEQYAMKEKWSDRLLHSLEVRHQARKEANEVLDRLQNELDTKGYYTLT